MYKDTAKKEYKFKEIIKDGKTFYEVTILSSGKTTEITKEVYDELIPPYRKADGTDKRDRKRLLSSDYQYSTYADHKESFSLYDLLDCNKDPLDICIEKERKQNLYKAIRKLSNAEQELIINIGFNEMSEREYASLINCPHSTVNYRYKKAKKNLKKIFISLDK